MRYHPCLRVIFQPWFDVHGRVGSEVRTTSELKNAFVSLVATKGVSSTPSQWELHLILHLF